MSWERDIEEILADIRSSVYGRDVRQAIVDGIEKCYNDPHIVDPSSQALIVDNTARQAAAAADDKATTNANALKLKIDRDAGYKFNSVNLTHNGSQQHTVTLKLRRMGNFVFAQFNGSFNVQAANKALSIGGTIPTGWRPYETAYINIVPIVSNASDGAVARLAAYTNGTLKFICNKTGAHEFCATATWFTNNPYPS